MKATIFCLMLILLGCQPPASGIPPGQAKDNVGKKVTVCGVISDVHQAFKITFLNMGGKYPNNTFTIVIFPKNQRKFITVAELSDKTVCVTGTVRMYRGKPEIIVDSPSQLVTR